ncbi:MAG: DUF4286 family protein [Bacteroidia bacterium]|nr:DUF4286 family protein [Bacteroidia bacterium]
MIIYNVTVNVEDSIHLDWLNWMKTKHVKDVVGTGCFTSYRMCRLLGTEDSGVTYAIQYFASSLAEFHRYDQHFAPKLRQEVLDRYQDKCLSFRTLMEVVD